MEIKFCGAAQSVTGSQHLVTVNGKKVLLDCGLFQGRRQEALNRNLNFLFNPADVDILLLSHAHIDHSGNIPNLVKQGFKGTIYTSHATADLCRIMLMDSAHIQDKDAQWLNKKQIRLGGKPIQPLYSAEDVERALNQFVGLEYDQGTEIVPGVHATFRDAGHILGSAGILLEITENDRHLRFGFTGDIGRKNMPIISDPNYLRDLDGLVMESTYGDRSHKSTGDIEAVLVDLIQIIVARSGKVIVPAFAVGRTQQFIYILHKLFDQNRIPEIPIYVDSPLAINATSIFRNHPECFDEETFRFFLLDRQDPFGFERLNYIQSLEASKALNHLKKPHIIISASGMAETGRILHHLKNGIGNSNNLILLIGFAAENTLARKLIDGEKIVRIFGEDHLVRAQVVKLDDFSAHADRDELMEYLAFNPPDRLRHLFLVHGEKNQSMPLLEALRAAGYQNVMYPSLGESFKF